MSFAPPPPDGPPGALPIPSTAQHPSRPSPARAATLAAFQYKSRASSQPAGERLPGTSPNTGRDSPNAGSTYGVIGGSRAPSRFSGPVPGPGTATRANSFSVLEAGPREPRNIGTLNRTLSSHVEEHPNRSRSTSPFPTFSPSSSVSGSPNIFNSTLPHSPPRAEANVSRSRSQSLAGGPRMTAATERVGPMSALDNTGTFPRNVAWPPPDSNMSPFARGITGLFGQTSQPAQPPSESQSRWLSSAKNAWGASVPNNTRSPLSASVANTFGGSFGAPAHQTVVGGFESGGGKSGSSSRRHSVSVVGGPGGRRDQFGQLGMSVVSPPGRGLGPLGLSDEDLLPEQLGNALNLEIDQNRQRGVDIEVRDRGIPTTQSLPKFDTTRDSGIRASIGGTSPARGRPDQVQAPTDRAPSGETKSRFSFEPGPPAGRGGLPAPGIRASSALVLPPPRVPPTLAVVPAQDSRPFGLPPTGYGMPYHGGGRPPYGNQYPGPWPDYGRPPQGGYPGYYGGPPQGPMQRPPPPGYYGYPPYQQHYQQQPPQPYYPPPMSPNSPHPNSPSSFSQLSLADLGRGIPLHSLGPETPLYIVAFKAGRRDLFYCSDPTLLISNGDRVVVEADRGSDLGTVVYDSISIADIRDFQEKQATAALLSGASQHQPPGAAAIALTSPPKGQPSVLPELEGMDLDALLAGIGGGQMDIVQTPIRGPLAREIMPKRIFTKSSQSPEEQAKMADKLRDEEEALVICREKVMQRGLPMTVVDAEYQWDRRKLTFYFKAEKRVDFRDLTKENFRIFKSRIWMSMVPMEDPRN